MVVVVLVVYMLLLLTVAVASFPLKPKHTYLLPHLQQHH